VKPGSHSEELISSIDWYPTILDMLEIRRKPDQHFDGQSFVPALKGKRLGRDTVFCHFPHYIDATSAIPATYVRKGDWKLIRLYCDNDDQSDRFELYNLKDDISEEHNLADKHPEKVMELNALISKFLKDTNAAVPKPNPDYKPPATK
jgi:arylsulfatase A-like enzyme